MEIEWSASGARISLETIPEVDVVKQVQSSLEHPSQVTEHVQKQSGKNGNANNILQFTTHFDFSFNCHLFLFLNIRSLTATTKTYS